MFSRVGTGKGTTKPQTLKHNGLCSAVVASAFSIGGARAYSSSYTNDRMDWDRTPLETPKPVVVSDPSLVDDIFSDSSSLQYRVPPHAPVNYQYSSLGESCARILSTVKEASLNMTRTNDRTAPRTSSGSTGATYSGTHAAAAPTAVSPIMDAVKAAFIGINQRAKANAPRTSSGPTGATFSGTTYSDIHAPAAPNGVYAIRDAVKAACIGMDKRAGATASDSVDSVSSDYKDVGKLNLDSKDVGKLNLELHILNRLLSCIPKSDVWDPSWKPLIGGMIEDVKGSLAKEGVKVEASPAGITLDTHTSEDIEQICEKFSATTECDDVDGLFGKSKEQKRYEEEMKAKEIADCKAAINKTIAEVLQAHGLKSVDDLNSSNEDSDHDDVDGLGIRNNNTSTAALLAATLGNVTKIKADRLKEKITGKDKKKEQQQKEQQKQDQPDSLQNISYADSVDNFQDRGEQISKEIMVASICSDFDDLLDRISAEEAQLDPQEQAALSEYLEKKAALAKAEAAARAQARARATRRYSDGVDSSSSRYGKAESTNQEDTMDGLNAKLRGIFKSDKKDMQEKKLEQKKKADAAADYFNEHYSLTNYTDGSQVNSPIRTYQLY